MVLLGALMLFPRMSKVDHEPQVVPAFFSGGTYQRVLKPDEVVFAIPKNKGEELLWQDAADFSFRLPQGYLGPVPASFFYERLSRGLALFPSSLRYDSASDLVRWLNEHQVTAVVMAQEGLGTFGSLLRSAGGQPVYQGDGVVVWRAPSGTWSVREQPL